jgi:monoamine oxidase
LQFPSDLDNQQCAAIRDTVEEITTQSNGPLQLVDSRKYLDSITFETFVRDKAQGSLRGIAMARVWAHAMIGCEPGEVSALFMLDYIRAAGGLLQLRSDRKHGGQYLRIKEGTQAVSERMAERLQSGSLQLQSVVHSVQEIPGTGLSLVLAGKGSTQRTYVSRRVLLTIPSPVYRTISFSPSLSPAKSVYMNSTRYSSYTKYLVIFKKPFWRENGYSGLAQSFVGPVSVFRDTSLEEGGGANYGFTCFIAAAFGRSWSALSAEQKQATVLEQIGVMFNHGDPVDQWFIQALESPWMTQEHSGWGCPIPTLSTGVYHQCWDAFVRSEGNLHFAGNEMATIWRGYMDGCLRTAESAVAEICVALKKEKSVL